MNAPTQPSPAHQPLGHYVLVRHVAPEDIRIQNYRYDGQQKKAEFHKDLDMPLIKANNQYFVRFL